MNKIFDFSSRFYSPISCYVPLSQTETFFYIPPETQSRMEGLFFDPKKFVGCALEEKGETLALTLGDSKIVLRTKGDITKEKSDFIVNAANEEMLGGGGVDGAIVRAGGKALDFFRRLVPEIRKGIRCPVGEARLTDAGELPSLFCIHAVGPRFDAGKHLECRAQLGHAYAASLKAAHDFAASLQETDSDSDDPRRPLGSKEGPQEMQALRASHEKTLKERICRGESLSISFPTLSTGIFGYPKEEGAVVSLNAALEYLQENQGKPGIKTIQFVFLENQADVPYYRQALQQISQTFSN